MSSAVLSVILEWRILSVYPTGRTMVFMVVLRVGAGGHKSCTRRTASSQDTGGLSPGLALHWLAHPLYTIFCTTLNGRNFKYLTNSNKKMLYFYFMPIKCL